jgi:hypothetical protein
MILKVVKIIVLFLVNWLLLKLILRRPPHLLRILAAASNSNLAVVTLTSEILLIDVMKNEYRFGTDSGLVINLKCIV